MPQWADLALEPENEKVCYGESFGAGKGAIVLKKRKHAINNVYSPTLEWTLSPDEQLVRVSADSLKDGEVAKWVVSSEMYEEQSYALDASDAQCPFTLSDRSVKKSVERTESLVEEDIELVGAEAMYLDDRISIVMSKNTAAVTVKFPKGQFVNGIDFDCKDVAAVETDKSSMAVYTDKLRKAMMSKGGVSWDETLGMQGTFYLYRRKNTYGSLGCESNKVRVDFNFAEDIVGNTISMSGDSYNGSARTYYACENSDSPVVTGSWAKSGLSGGFGGYSAKWIYRKKDGGGAYSQIPGSESDTAVLAVGRLTVADDYEIRRVVVSGNGSIRDTSDAVFIVRYRHPGMYLEYNVGSGVKVVDDARLGIALLCYDAKPLFGVSVKNAESEQRGISNMYGDVEYRIMTQGESASGEAVAIDTAFVRKNGGSCGDWQFKYPATVTATQEFCGEKVEVAYDLSVEVKDDISFNSGNFSFKCPIFGEEMEIVPLIDDESEYEYRVNNTTYRENKVVLPSKEENEVYDGRIQVSRTLDGCTKTQDIRVGEVMEPLADAQIAVRNGAGKNAALICPGIEYVIDDEEPGNKWTRYKWTRKTMAVMGGADLSFVGSTTGKSAVVRTDGDGFSGFVIRTRTLGGGCQTKSDTLVPRTAIARDMEQLSDDNFKTSAEELCDGERIELAAIESNDYNVTGWGFAYKGDTTLYEKAATKWEYTPDRAGVYTFIAELTHADCPNTKSLYSRDVRVAPDLTIGGLASVPEEINTALYSSANQSINVKVTDTVGAGQTYDFFRAEDEEEWTRKSVAQGVWTYNFSADKEDAEEKDYFTVFAYRLYRFSVNGKTCASDTFALNIPVNNGFDNIVIEPSGHLVYDGGEASFCGDGSLTLLTEQITYDNALVDAEKISVKWQKRIGNGVWTNIPGEKTATLTLKDGAINGSSTPTSYKATVTLIKGGAAYTQGSNIIKVIPRRRARIDVMWNLGGAYGDTKFEFCPGTTYSDLRMIDKAKDGNYDAPENAKYAWYRMEKGGEWELIKDAVDDGVVRNSGTSNMIYGKAFEREAYFKCEMTDQCGLTAESNWLYFAPYGDTRFDAEEVSVIGQRIIDREDGNRLTFFVGTDPAGKYRYNWYASDRTTSATKSGTGNTYIIDSANDRDTYGWDAGTHSLYVEREVGRGCVSNKVKVEWILADTMKVYAGSVKTDTMCIGNVATTCAAGVEGGGVKDSVFTTVWYYKSESYGAYRILDLSDLPNGISVENSSDVENSIIKINGVEETYHFYARIYNPGYPLKYETTKGFSVNVYPRLSTKSPHSDKSIYCYNADATLTAGETSGGTGRYSYAWTDTSDTKRVYPPLREITVTDLKGDRTFMCVVGDGCSKDTTRISVAVRDAQYVTPDDYTAAKFAEKRRMPYVAVNNASLIKSLSYTLTHIDQSGVEDAKQTIEDGATSRVFDEMPPMTYAVERFVISKVDKFGCESIADTFTIDGIDEVTAGTLAFAEYPDTKEIAVCSGERIGAVTDERIANGGSDITYSWYYGEVGGPSTGIRDSAGMMVATSNFVIDTTAIARIVNRNTNSGNTVKRYYIYRTATMNVTESDGTERSYTKYSDSLFISVAPVLNCNIDNLAGKISTQTPFYCVGDDRSDAFELEIDEAVVKEYWGKRSFGALQQPFGHKLTTYWEFSKGSRDNFTHESEQDYEEDAYMKTYRVSGLDSTTYVRFTISDGCSEYSSNVAVAKVASFADDSADNYRIPSYAEAGDNITVSYIGTYQADEWYHTTYDAEPFSTNFKVALDSVSQSTRLYHKRITSYTRGSTEISCAEPDFYEVPIVVYPKSEGGYIIGDQKICAGDDYEDIRSYSPATGGTGKFRYSWQMTTDTADMRSWVAVANAYDEDLPFATLRKGLVSGRPNYVRRVAMPICGEEAVNKEAYERYSNIVKLDTYRKMTVGGLEWEGEGRDGYCSYDNVPSVVATAPDGGSAEDGGTLRLVWMLDINGGGYDTISVNGVQSGGSARINMDYFKTAHFAKNGKDKTAEFAVKAVFTDARCGEIATEPIVFKVYAKDAAPELYITADDCDSKYISFRVENDSAYLYDWTIGTDSLNPVRTDFKEQYEMSFERNPQYTVDYNYSVRGMSKTTGCLTDVVYFTIDSLPPLKQDAVMEQTDEICYNSALIVELAPATGGTGTKKYQWMYSYDGEEWISEPKDTMPAFTNSHIKSSVWLKRVAYTTVCRDTIETAPVHFKVRDAVPCIPLVAREDFCTDQRVRLRARLAEYDTEGMRLYLFTEGWYDLHFDVFENEDGEYNFVAYSFELENGESEKTAGYYYTVEGGKCVSDTAYITYYRRSAVNKDANLIDADETVACNGTEITISGWEDLADEGKSDTLFKSAWMVSADKENWTVCQKFAVGQRTLDIKAKDTLYYKRVVTNGCADTSASNIVAIYGTPVRESVLTEAGAKTNYMQSGRVDLRVAADYMFNVVSSAGDTIAERVSDFDYSVAIADAAEYYTVSEDGGALCYKDFVLRPLSGGDLMPECAGVKSIVSGVVRNAPDTISPYYQWFTVSGDGIIAPTYDDNMDYVVTETYRIVKYDLGKRFFRATTYNGGANAYYYIESSPIEASVSGPTFASQIKPAASYYDSLGLRLTNGELEAMEGMTVTLKAKVEGLASGVWQYQKQGKTTWTELGRLDAEKEEQSYSLTAGETLVYRIKATNTCGTTYSDTFQITLVDIEPVRPEHIIIDNPECVGGLARIRCTDDEFGRLSGQYSYYYHVSGDYDFASQYGDLKPVDYVNLNPAEYKNTFYSLEFSDGLATDAYIYGLRGKATVSIRKVKVKNKAQTETTAEIEPTRYITADFSLGTEEGDFTADGGTVVLPSASRISLKNTSEGADTYEWSIVYHYKGLGETSADYRQVRSAIESPFAYIYNKGAYSILLTAKGGSCVSKAVWNDAIRVSGGSLRSGNAFADFGESELEVERYAEDRIGGSVADAGIFVYPAVFDTKFYIDAPGAFAFAVFDAKGVRVMDGSEVGLSEIDASNLPRGIYEVVVNGTSFRILK